MSEFHWDRFKRSIFIDAPSEKIFNAWVIPDQIETWFLKRAVFRDREGVERAGDTTIESGDSYAWNWWNYSITEEGRIITVDKNSKHLEFNFAKECIVTVNVNNVKGDTLLTLEQKNIPTDEDNRRNIHMGCSQGWSFWMANLKAWLEHGILLHDQESTHRTEDYGFCELINR